MTKKHAANVFASLAGRWAVLLLIALQSGTLLASEWEFTGVDRVVAVSDIHGAYDTMVKTFATAGIIDDDLVWIGGATHLVITGDLLDRGPDSRKVMDLIMRLEPEALAAGGRVHQLIGNHEVMNLTGDLRYVAAREYAAFADDESEEEREQWFLHYQSLQLPDSDEMALRANFDKQAPPGFFGHRRAFRADGHYGKWLLDKPLMVVIDGTAFVHGGISPFVAEYGLDGVNGDLKTGLRRYVSEVDMLADQGILSPTVNFYDHPAALQAAIISEQLSEPQKVSAELIIGLNSSPIHGQNSPLWYRGTVGCSDLIEGDALNAALARIGAHRAVIGHTPTITRRVLQRMNGRVIEIDTGMNYASYKGSGNALLIEGGTLTVINQSGETNSPPVDHPRRVGYRSPSISADNLEQILSSGTITNTRVDGEGRTLVQFQVDDKALNAWFEERPRKKGSLPELAAYRLDRMIGLDMVPVTVRREVNGKQGTLQFSPESTKSEQERGTTGGGGSAWCALQRQWNTMYLFDALIFNPVRNPTVMLYSKDNWQLMLVNHDESFRNAKNRPPHLKNIPLEITNSWLDALNGLTDDALQEKLGDVLDKRQLAALAKRRDRLIEEGAGPAQ